MDRKRKLWWKERLSDVRVGALAPNTLALADESSDCRPGAV